MSIADAASASMACIGLGGIIETDGRATKSARLLRFPCST
jgi:hypothetical protein